MSSHARRCGAALGVAAALVLAGCTDASEETASPDTSSSTSPRASTSTSASPSPSTSPSSSPSPTDSASPATTASAHPAGLRGLLPTAAELPGLNRQWQWQVARTRPAPAKPFGACAPVEMSLLGASRGVQRDYRPAQSMGSSPGTAAAALALEFPDRTTTERARSVLVSWHDKCRQRLLEQGVEDPNLTPFREVPSGSSDAWWYLTRWSTGDTGHFQSFGIAVRDDRMVLLTIDHDGQDHNYAPRAEPMYRAVRKIDELFTPAG